MQTWKVSYHNIADKLARRPFWKNVAYVAAESRAEAISKVSAKFPPPRYGNYRASVYAGDHKPSSMFA